MWLKAWLSMFHLFFSGVGGKGVAMTPKPYVPIKTHIPKQHPRFNPTASYCAIWATCSTEAAHQNVPKILSLLGLFMAAWSGTPIHVCCLKNRLNPSKVTGQEAALYSLPHLPYLPPKNICVPFGITDNEFRCWLSCSLVTVRCANCKTFKLHLHCEAQSQPLSSHCGWRQRSLDTVQTTVKLTNNPFIIIISRVAGKERHVAPPRWPRRMVFLHYISKCRGYAEVDQTTWCGMTLATTPWTIWKSVECDIKEPCVLPGWTRPVGQHVQRGQNVVRTGNNLLAVNKQ